MRKLSNRFLLLLGSLTLIAASFLVANRSTEIDLYSQPVGTSATVVGSHNLSTSLISSQASGQAKKNQQTESAIEIYEEQDSEKSTAKRYAQAGNFFILISFALALLLIYRKGRHQLLWLTHSLETLPKSYILFRVFRI